MYLENKYSNYNYLIELHDNYAILSTSSHISGSSGDSDSVNAIANYFDPHYVVPFTYHSEESFSFNYITTSDNIEDRGDFPKIFICGFILIFVLIFIINNLSKLFKKGGIFGFN